MLKINKIFLTGFILILALPLMAGGVQEDSAPMVEKTPAETTQPQESIENSADAGDSWIVYPPQGWEVDFHEAYRIANEEGKNIFINFTGSDWCVWCHKIRDEILNTPEFEAYAEENLVLLFLDFPSDVPLSDKQKEHNGILQGILGVEGFPTLWMIGPDLEPLIRTGYQAGGPVAFIKHLEEDRFDLSDEDKTNFQQGFGEAIEQYLGSLN